MGRPAKIFFKETFQRKNGCKRSFLPCLRLCLCDSCNKPTVPTNNEVPTNQVPTNPPNSPNQVPTNATSSWRISPDNEVPTNSPNHTHQRHLLMEDITRQRSTHRPTQPSIHQRPSTHQPSTHLLLLLLLMEDITSHFANASTPSMGNPMHTGETRTPSVGPRDQGSATSTATLTVATSSLLPVHRGASLPWPVTSSRAQNGSEMAWKNNFRFFSILQNQLALSNIMIL